MVVEFIQLNFSTIITCVFLLIFICTNVTFEKRMAKLFSVAVMLDLLLVAVDTVEFWLSELTYPTMGRIWMSAIGYTIRPLILMLIISVTLRNRKFQVLYVMPVVINGIIAFSALFSNVAFSYDMNNEFVRGPLGMSAHFTSVIYTIILMIHSIQMFRDKNRHEGLIVFAIIVVNTAALLMEMMKLFNDLLNSAIAISITFYYMYLNTQQFKRDQLTGALNRRCLYLDAEQKFSILSAVISLDLNNLKTLNDTEGHAEGDLAIRTMAECVRRLLKKGCYLYRVGGDEFVILCFRCRENELVDMIASIKREMSKTKYSCAIGLAMLEEGQDFEQVNAAADKAMYKDKMRMKA